MSNSRIKKKPTVARQYELSQAHIKNNSINTEPGGLPDMPAEGLPPDNRPHINRAKEISKNDDKSTSDFHLGLEAIDEAIFYYFENVIKPSVLSNGDLIDVPVIYGSGERWKLAQRDGFYRDKGGKVQAPLVMIKRESIEKRRDLGNKLDANNPQLYVTYQEKFTRKNSYDNFNLLNNRLPQKEFTATVVPDYVNLTYQGIIWTDYISQLNKIIEAINYASDSYWGDSEQFKFMATIDQFSNINELTTDDSRIVRANFTLKLQGYLIPDNIQKKLKEQNTRFFSKSQVILDTTTTRIDDKSSRALHLGASNPIISSGGGGGGGGTTTTSTSTTDDDWLIFDSHIRNSEGRDVSIESAQLKVDIGNKGSDIFLIQKSNDIKLKVDNNGLLSLNIFNTFPSAIEGGLLFKGSEFYIGI
jgi:hypothetical protein|tara:strand:- start:2030 stop:3277 length:1248 start_codon:yes stop_codon:yes gene_type:complete